jgi:hypothetical protein
VNWRPALPELVISAVTVAAAALAAAGASGWPGVVVVAAVAAALSVLLLRALVPRPPAQTLRQRRDQQKARPIAGYSQRRFVVAASLRSRPVYEGDLRPVLEHVLAARLAERHAVNLYSEPERARQVFCRTQADLRLWQWVDPAQAPDPGKRVEGHGIPRRTLARLITRLEQL